MPPPRYQADEYFRLAEEAFHLVVLGHQAQVAGQRQLAAATQGQAVDRGDEHLVHAAHVRGDLMEQVHVGDACQQGAPQQLPRPRQVAQEAFAFQQQACQPGRHGKGDGGDGALDLVDVEVGQEDPVRRSGKDDGADVLALLKVFQQVGQLLHHRRGEEVRRGIVEQDLQDASSLFYAQVSRC